MDDYSRYTWIFLLNSKSEVIVALTDFFLMMKNVHSAVIKSLRTDSGCEFFKSQVPILLKSLEILHQRSCVYTPQQNGEVERRHRYILDNAQAIRFQASVHLMFWGDCVAIAVYSINRLPSQTLHDKVSVEVLSKTTPDLSHLKVFGCLDYSSSLKKSDKLLPRAAPAVFLGYSLTQQV